MATKYVSVPKLQEHYSWWENDLEMSEYKQVFDDIILVQPEAPVDEKTFSSWSVVCQSEDRLLIQCEACESEFDVAKKDVLSYQRCPHCGAYITLADSAIDKILANVVMSNEI